jgi:putative transposase
MEAYVHGVSTRSVDDLVTAMGVESGVSTSEVSRICTGLDKEIDAFRSRSLAHTQFPYVFCDATFCKVRIGAHVVSQALVAATGVSIEGTREVLSTAVGDSESYEFWREFLASLRARGLTGVHLGLYRVSRGVVALVLSGACRDWRVQAHRTRRRWLSGLRNPKAMRPTCLTMRL